MATAEIQPLSEPSKSVPQPRRQLSRAETVSFKDLKSFMADAFREVDAENTHVEGLCARTDQPESRTLDHAPSGGSPTSTRPFQLPHSATTSFNRTLGRQASERLRRELMEIQQDFPVRPQSPRMEARLERQCERGVEFLELLQQPAYNRTEENPGPVMPKTALLYSRGLAFSWRSKVGLVSGLTWGSGFVIARLGPGVWSAPCFLRDRFYSLGATLGVSTTATCYAIPTEAGLQHFKEDDPGGGLDVALTLGMDPFEGNTPVRVAAVADRVAPTDRAQDRIKSYRVCDGMILDVSLRCGYHAIDWGTNQALYGDNIDPADILDGKVQAPAQFRPLYAAIEQLSHEAAGVKATASQFELEKERVRAASMSRQASLLRRLRSNSGSRTSASGSADGSIVRKSPGDAVDTLPSSASSTTVPSPPDVASPDSSFVLFADFIPLDINLDDDEPLPTITEQHTAETADAAA